MMSKTNDSSSQVLPQGDNGAISGPQPGSLEHQGSRNRNQVIKSGPLFISSKGIGWTSWKKRWFILTRTSLVFFRSDPNAAPPKGGEVNLTLGGIDLNNSASVDVKVDKKLLTVFFPDGRDGRAFTLKAETMEDLHEWKTALENALKLAPSATQVAGQNGLFKSDQADPANGSADQQNDNSMVIGRPILLALEEVDGSPSFLEKALRYIEDHGVKVEGILRQAADVDDVHRRVREYEQGKTDFSTEEDAHVIGDCIKYILRELPSSPVPASCCNALLEALRTDRNNRLNAMRTAILETFPEPNRRLLQRILLMMQSVVSNKTVNRMSTSGVAACMSPLLLRPLLAGDCELENTHMDVAGDGSFQLLQAAAAANHAQAIIITLLDEYDNIFGESSVTGDFFSDSDESGTGTEEASDDDMYDDDDYDEEDDDEEEQGSGSDDHEEETDDDDDEQSVIETCSESGSGDHTESDSCDEKHSQSSSCSTSPEHAKNNIAKQRAPSISPRSPATQKDDKQRFNDNTRKNNDRLSEVVDIMGKSHRQTILDSSRNELAIFSPPERGGMSSTKLLGASQVRRPSWGRTSARKNLSMESIDFVLEDGHAEIQRLEAIKSDLQSRIMEEANGNAVLQASLERRKKALDERRLALEKDVSRLQDQLQKELNLRAALEAVCNISQLPPLSGISEKTQKEIHEMALAQENFNGLKQRFDDIGSELYHQREHNAALMHDRLLEIQGTSSQGTMSTNSKENMRGTSIYAEKSSRDDRNYSADRSDRGKNDPLLHNEHNQPHTSQGGNPKYGWLPNNSPSKEASSTKPSPSGPRKSSAKGEGASATALSKLTNRLNFLKEKRDQLANELQYMDRTRGFCTLPALSPGKAKAPELPITHGKNENYDAHQSSHSEGDNNRKTDNKKSSNTRSDAPSSHSPRKGMPNENDSNRKVNPEDTYRKGSSSKTDAQNLEQGRKSEYQPSQHHLDRVKLEAQSSISSEKGSQQQGHNSSASRTFSR